MLEMDTSASASDDLPRPPAGRRSATRPAGPPQTALEEKEGSQSVKKETDNAAHEITSDEGEKKPSRRRATRRSSPRKARNVSTDTDEKVSADSPSTLTEEDQGDNSPSRPRSRRGQISRARRRPNSDDTSEAPVEENQNLSAEESIEEKPRRSRRRSRSKVVDEPNLNDRDHEEVSTIEIDPVAQAVEDLFAPDKSDKEQAVTKRSRVRRQRSSRQSPTSKESDTTAKETEESPSEVQKPARRRRRSSVSQTPLVSEDRTSDGEVESLLTSLEEERQPRRRRATKESAGELVDDIPLNDQGEVDTDQVLASLAASIAQESDEGIEESAEDQKATDSPESEGDDESTTSRRRRRRGGRRRRKNTVDVDDESEQDNDATPPSNDETNEEGDETGHRRRRRRTRNRGEQSEDEATIKVREPRVNDEILGIEGSTRLEAKKQRRRDSRQAGRHRAPLVSEAEFLARRENVERTMLVRERDDYTQLAVMEDGVLVEHYVDRSSSTSLIGNIYLGRIQNVLPSMEAVFVDIGRGRNAVLYAGEVDWDAFDVSSDSRKVEQVFKSGQSVIVQVSKDPVGAKGARLTGHISIPGRFVVYSPGGHLSGISRKLPESERRRLKGIIDSALDESSSVIVRTAADGASETDLLNDITRLKAQWEAIQKKASQSSAPMPLHAEPDLTLRIIRDTFTEDFSELIVAAKPGRANAWKKIHDYIEQVSPALATRVTKWRNGRTDPFEKYRIDEQIAKALERKVFLPSGGSLVIDRTEAMTVIDVNTGKFTGSGGNLEETVTRNNLEAAEEIVRQLRLRDLGGIIVIDFIDMVLPSNRELLLRRLVECLGRDRTRHQVSEVTSLGLVQLTRKRIGTGLAEAFTEQCSCCGGRGYVRHDEPVESQAPADGGERKAYQRKARRTVDHTDEPNAQIQADESRDNIAKDSSGDPVERESMDESGELS